MYIKYQRQKFPVPKHYIENGFDINQNNSVSAGMFRLLNYWEYIVHPIMPNEDVEPFIQLLWEVEDCLPKDFDEDESGMQFVTFIRKMFDREIPKIKVKEENWEEYSMERKRTMINYLSVWQHYSLRFRNNKGLDRAFKYFLVNENIF